MIVTQTTTCQKSLLRKRKSRSSIWMTSPVRTSHSRSAATVVLTSSRKDVKGRWIILCLYLKFQIINLTYPENKLLFTFSCILWIKLYMPSSRKQSNVWVTPWKPVSTGWCNLMSNDTTSIKHMASGNCKGKLVNTVSTQTRSKELWYCD